MAQTMPLGDEIKVIDYIQWRSKMEAQSNEDLARALLKAAPCFGNLSDLCEIAAERLAPGIIERMADELDKSTNEAHDAKRGG